MSDEAWWTCRKCMAPVVDPPSHRCAEPEPEPEKVVPRIVLIADCPHDDCNVRLPYDSDGSLTPGEVIRCWNCDRKLRVAQPREVAAIERHALVTAAATLRASLSNLGNERYTPVEALAEAAALLDLAKR